MNFVNLKFSEIKINRSDFILKHVCRIRVIFLNKLQTK